MAISKDSGISAADVNAVINSVQTTYKKYGFSGNATTVSSDVAASAAAINAAINKLNSAILDSTNRRFYYHKGSSTIGTVSSGTALSASKISEISTTNTSVANDYCNCDNNCSCDCDDCSCDCDDCCWNDCTCDSDCSCDRDVSGCGIDSDCSDMNCCDSDCCDSDCCHYD